MPPASVDTIGPSLVAWPGLGSEPSPKVNEPTVGACGLGRLGAPDASTTITKGISMDVGPIYMCRPGLRAKLALLMTASAVFFAAGSAIQVENSSASRGSSCTFNNIGQDWACHWYDTDLAPETRHWFQAANTLRNWKYAAVNDINNNVAKKCIKIKRSSDGNISNVACTHDGGNPDSFIGENRRPGWLFTIHWAPGPRYISGDGYHN